MTTALDVVTGLAISQEARAAADREAQRQERQRHRTKSKTNARRHRCRSVPFGCCMPIRPGGTNTSRPSRGPSRTNIRRWNSKRFARWMFQRPMMPCSFSGQQARSSSRRCGSWNVGASPIAPVPSGTKNRSAWATTFGSSMNLLLVGARGIAPPIPDAGLRLPSIIRSRRSDHSEKPTFVYSCLEAMYPTFNRGDRVELFSREPALAGRHGAMNYELASPKGEPRFDLDLDYGKQAELQLGEYLDWIAAGNGRVEVKHKRLPDLDFYVETENDPGAAGQYQPSGISITTAQPGPS